MTLAETNDQPQNTGGLPEVQQNQHARASGREE